MDIITPVLAGAAGSLIVKLTDKSVDWLIQLVAHHSPAVQEKAEKNLQNFVNRLAKRVEQLEADLPIDQRGVFEDALNHPSSSLLMQKAMVSAATTENDDRHTILSELIAQRLTAGADDMVALVGGASCDVINSLSSKHIKLLGLIVRLYSIRPDQPPDIRDKDAYNKYLISWWEVMGDLCKDIKEIHRIDLDHLVGLSCIRMSIVSTNLGKLLNLPLKTEKMEVNMAEFEALAWWQIFHKIWDSGLDHAKPTSIGALIGTLYHDSYLKSITAFRW